MNAWIHLSRVLKRVWFFLRNIIFFEAGEYDVLMSEISNTEACCSVYEEYNSSLDALADPLIGKVEMEHCFKDEVAEQSITVNDVAASQEDGEDTELGNLFIEDDSFIAALPLQVSMTQNKVRVKDKPASKDLEKLEGIWKKVLCNLHYDKLFSTLTCPFLVLLCNF